ncbi:hypothetical protein MOJ79_10940 [Calidifontimicrobium sp. SYSU G02091]|uniref:hypothetical protein n=1 Tax=Calidifontimicrobium sp. SYSU G02091 TaxID=2926421 RepID=UPI001F530377|nr:hypothetical protein [Calidifontimicrobium sp. SYSU G02091]MCI1192358.1 hypothetical protein [Calidifontimicrobium sp. SYSU G02091]
MALLFIDGFDHYDPQALDPFGDPWLARGKAAYLSPQATRIPGRRPSSYALRLPAGSGGGYVKNLDATKTSLIVGAAIRVAPFENTGFEPVLLGVRDASAQITHLVKIGEDGRLKLYRRQSGYDTLLSTSLVTAPARGWHYVELKVVQGTGSGTLDVRVNGILAIQLTAQNTLQGGGPLLTAFVGAVPGEPCPVTVDVDDLYLADTSGTLNTTFLGDVRVDALQPQADGALKQWAVEGAASAWQAVSDGDEASGIRAATAGLRQTFDVEALPVMTTPAIHGVQVTLLARKTDAGSGRVRGLVASGAQTAVSADLVLQEQLAWHTALIERNPNGNVQWTEGAFNAAEFGLESA